MKGKVQTVLGWIEPEKLGITFPHEHLLLRDMTSTFELPLPSHLPEIVNFELDLKNSFWLRQYPYSFKENLLFNDEIVQSAVLNEMKLLKKVGGGTVVDNCPIGIRTDIQANYLRDLAIKTGINIIAGTGFYVTSSQDSNALKMTLEEMHFLLTKEITKGMNDTDIKCGVIGEIGCSWPLTDFEKKVLKCSAEVQEELKCPVIIHPGRNKRAPQEIIRIFQESGGKVNQTVMSHLDRTLVKNEELAEFASMGTFCEFDLFGTEVSYYQLDEETDMPSDAERISRIRYLIEHGFSENILISHDIHTKHKLLHYGGHGYSHILLNIVPKMLKRGISQTTINNILINNPKRWLTFQ